MSNIGPAQNPQLNLVLKIVAPVIAVIACLALWFTKPVITAPAPPTAVNVAAAKVPDSGLVMANQLPNAGAGAAGGGAAGGPPAGAGSFGGPPGGGRAPGRKPMGGAAN